MIQIAGVKNKADVAAIVDAGVQYIGFPLRLGYHAEDIPDSKVKEIVKELPSSTTPVLITYLRSADAILNLADFIGIGMVQIHSDIDRSELIKLKETRPSIRIIKSLVIRADNLESLKRNVKELHLFADFFITDTFDPSTGAEGATGKTHDWRISKELVQISPKPVILAGGLTPHNVEAAISAVKPFGVDSHTGVENSEGYKDPQLVKEFALKAKQALGLLERG